MGGQAHLPATHVSQTKPRNCPSTRAGGQSGEGWKGGESKRMLIWQLQNCPRTDGKCASEEKRENENERKSAGRVVTDMMTHIHKADINKCASFRLKLQITRTAHTHTDG